MVRHKSGFGTYVLEDTFNGYEGDGTCFTSGHDKQSDGGGGQRSAVNGGGEDLNNLETLATDADDRVLSVDGSCAHWLGILPKTYIT